MPRPPAKLILFVLVGSLVWIRLAPGRAEQAMRIFRKKREAGSEAAARLLVQDAVRREICSLNDLCEYRPSAWTGLYRPDTATVQLEHHFYADGALRRYLFRVRRGVVAEIIDLR
jgi:hypothetical protein